MDYIWSIAVTEMRMQRVRRYQKRYSETVLKLVEETKQSPALVADLAKQRTSDEWKREFGSEPEEWLPKQPEAN